MTDQNDRKKLAGLIRWGLLVVAGISVVFAVLHVFSPDRFNENTAMFLALAIVALVIDQITKVKVGNLFEVEKTVNELQEAVSELEKGVGPGSKLAVTPTVAELPALGAGVTKAAPAADPNDPNKGQFGGQPESNGRKLTAQIEPLAGPRSSRCRVRIKIVSTDPARPLTGKVKLHLHPTFGRWSAYELDVKGGVAEDEIVSYGAFTIGAEGDEGNTRLELNLVDVPGGTKRFYEE